MCQLCIKGKQINNYFFLIFRLCSTIQFVNWEFLPFFFENTVTSYAKCLLCCRLKTGCCYLSLFAQIFCHVVFSTSKQVLHNELNIIVMGISEVFYFCPPDQKSSNTCEDLVPTHRFHFLILSCLSAWSWGNCDRHFVYH